MPSKIIPPEPTEAQLRSLMGKSYAALEAFLEMNGDQFPMTLWLEPQAPHAVENLDTKPVRLIRVELKQADQAGT